MDKRQGSSFALVEIMTREYKELKTEMVYCDGGEFSSVYPNSSMLQANDSVYCAKRRVCNVILRLEDAQSCVKDITITAPPRSGYTNPVEHVAVFFSMNDHQLIRRSENFLSNSEIRELFDPPGEGDLHHDGKLLPLETRDYSKAFEEAVDAEDFCPVTYSSLIPRYHSMLTKPRSLDLDHSTIDPSSPPCKVYTPMCSSRYFPGSESLSPIVLGTIVNEKHARQLRASFETPLAAKYIVLRLTNTFQRHGKNVDIESVVIRGTSGCENQSMLIR